MAADAASITGRDGRLTLLLMGDDYRPTRYGHRTDSMMVVTINPRTGASAAVSVPRDIARFPLPNGTTYTPKVNGLYQHYTRQLGSAPAAARAMKRAFGYALGVEIDNYVIIGFGGVLKLVDAVGGVDVYLESRYCDPYYQVSRTQRGICFNAGWNHLNGKRALIFARSRKGDSDFHRSRRQQLLVMAAVRKVADRGAARLPALADTARDFLRTDIPWAASGTLFRIISKANLSTSRRQVLGPSRYATHIPGTSSYKLNIGVVRSLCDVWFAPVGSPDTTAPTAQAPKHALPTNEAISSAVPVRLTWSGSDTGSGVDRYQLQQSRNGGSWMSLALPHAGATALTRQLVPGSSYRFRVKATDGAGNSSAWTYGIAFKVISRQENSTAIRYTGTWVRQSLSSASGGYTKYSRSTGAKARLTFTGRGVALVAPKGPSRGYAQVYINGTRVASVNLYSGTTTARRIVFSRTFTTRASRTVEIRVVGTSGRPRVDVDAFVTFE